MDILEAVRQALWDEYNAGASQEEIAGKYALKQSHLSNFMNGKRKLSLEKIQSMYPNLTINLHGASIAPIVNTGSNTGTMTGIVNELNTVIDKILNSEDLSSDEKVKVLKVLKE